jgi:hypothetical protein
LLLKQALLSTGAANPRIAKRPLGEVIAEAERLGIFSRPTNVLTVANSMSAAKELRNIASHGSPWQEDDTERRATYSLVYLVCFAGYLFPRTNIAGQEYEPLAESQSNILDDEIYTDGEDVIPDLAAAAREELATRVRSCSPRSFLRLARIMAEDSTNLIAAFIENFGYLIENAGYGRVRNIFELALWCQDRGLPAQARSCGILLPHDAETLEWLGRQNPMRFVKYLNECRRAEPRLFDRTFNTGGVDSILRVSRDWLDRADINNGTIANLLTNVPSGALVHFLDENKSQIVTRIMEYNAPSGVAWLRLLARADRAAARTHEGIVAALVAKVTTDTDPIVAATPLRLAQLQVIDKPISSQIINQLMQRVVNNMDPYQAQRVVWDLYAMSQTYAQRAIEVAQAEFCRVRTTASPWVVLLWASVILAGGASADSIGELPVENLEWPSGTEHMMQQLRVGFVLSKLDVPLARSRTLQLGEYARNFTVRSNPSYVHSQAFIEECRRLFPIFTR